MPNNNPSKLAHLKMPDYSGSWFQIPYEDVTSMRIGKFTPFRPIDVPGGSLLKLKPIIRFDSLPAVSPLYGGYTMRTKFYFVPYRLYIPQLRRNRHLPWNSIPSLKLPTLRYYCNVRDYTRLMRAGVNTQYGASVSFAGSLLDRLGLAWGETVLGQSFGNPYLAVPKSDSSPGIVTFSVNALPLLAYIDAWMYGEFNPQDKNIPVDFDRVQKPSLQTFQVQRTYARSYFSYDALRARMDEIIYDVDRESTVTEANWSFSQDGLDPRYLLFNDVRKDFVSGYPLFSCIGGSNLSTYDEYVEFYNAIKNNVSAVGLLPVTYKGDRFSSWYSEEGINILKSYTITSGENFLSLRKRNDDFMLSALSLISGNRWVDYLQYVFDQDLELKDHPVMVGYDEQHFGMIEILSQAQTGEGLNGQLGARASMAREYNNQVKPISFKTKEPGLLLVCSSIVPSVTYFQGSDRFNYAQAVEDLWQPPYSSQGFMETFRGEYLNPWVMPDNVIFADGLYVAPSGVTSGQLNKLAVSWVPLGWQYMSGYHSASGALKTDIYKTWTNRRSSTAYQDNLGDVSQVVPFDFLEDAGVEMLSSTYVDSFQFNDNFVNVSKSERENFVVMLQMPYSIYQPISKTLITKSF